ncbi:NADPH-dependent FMN reductase [Rhodoligotrophos defluvii]|uniref:NADPH-dependent FMN reductase n=1 Tax=Rhodoligotrophos defluvii TaxID=2561934 RepID=UPI0010C9A7D3|nr:NAD(P)H-dependent oxidoreductase [Rhodoligotrophos defluvii]
MTRIAVFVGSLRKDSINKKFALALAKLARPSLDFRFVDLSEIPMFNEDIEQNPPQSVITLREEIRAADGVLFVTPEYNRSFPALLKNAIDWGSRPYGHNSWSGKPGSVVGTSMSPIGTAAAQAQLSHVLRILGVHLLGQPEVYLTYSEGLFDADHDVTKEDTRAFLEKYLKRFESWIERFRK